MNWQTHEKRLNALLSTKRTIKKMALWFLLLVIVFFSFSVRDALIAFLEYYH